MFSQTDFTAFFVFLILFSAANISHSEPVSLASSAGINLNEQKPYALAKLRDKCMVVETSYDELEYIGKNCDDNFPSEIEIKLKKSFFRKPTTKQVTETIAVSPELANKHTSDRIFRFSNEHIEAFILKQQMREIKTNPHSRILNEQKNSVGYWCRNEMGYDPEQLNIWKKNQCTIISASEIGSACNMEAQDTQVCYRRFQYILDKDQYAKMIVKRFTSGWVTLSQTFYDNS